MAPWRCEEFFNLGGWWVLKRVAFLEVSMGMRKTCQKRNAFFLSNVVIEYDMICMNVCIILRYMYIYIYTYTHMLLHVDQNVSESEMIKLYTTYAVNICIQWMRMMMACM